MSELAAGTTASARRCGPIRIEESTNGALMAYIPYKLTNIPFEGEHQLCLGAKDGSMQESNCQTLRDIFGWDGVPRLGGFNPPQAEGDEPEFKLVNWHYEPYEKNGKTVDKWVFQYLNRIGGNQTQEVVDAISSKWGKKLSLMFSGGQSESAPATETAKLVETPAEAPAKKKSMPGRKPTVAKVVYAEDVDVFEAMCLKHGGKKQSDMSEAEQLEMAEKHWFPACKAVMGDPDTNPQTAEQIAKVAEAIGV